MPKVLISIKFININLKPSKEEITISLKGPINKTIKNKNLKTLCLGKDFTDFKLIKHNYIGDKQFIEFIVKNNDRIAQMVLMPILKMELEEVDKKLDVIIFFNSCLFL